MGELVRDVVIISFRSDIINVVAEFVGELIVIGECEGVVFPSQPMPVEAYVGISKELWHIWHSFIVGDI